MESQHWVRAVVVDENAKTVSSWGNPEILTFPRSAIKMLQALPVVESGAAEAFGLEDRHLCLICSSHRGEAQHLVAVKEIMKKAGLREEFFVCGPHWPPHEPSVHEMVRRGLSPTPLMNNCSGKHSGILATCLHFHENPEGYDQRGHPAQVRLRQVLSEVTGFDHHQAPYGVDGCGIPTYALPLKNMARGMAALINPNEKAPRRKAAERILQAVQREPFYLSGSDHFTTDLIQDLQGRCVLKNGAEGVFCGVLPEKGLAFALKAEDGSPRAAQMATAFLLQKHGAFEGLQEGFREACLEKYLEPKIKNWKGHEVGHLRVRREQ